MNRSRIQDDQDGRLGTVRRRPRNRTRPAFESLEARSMLSVTHPATVSLAKLKVPAGAKAAEVAVPPSVAYPPYNISVEVGAVSAPAGDGHVFASKILVDGFALPYSTVWLATGPNGYFNTATKATSTGYYAFVIGVGRGTTQIRTFAEAPTQSYSNVSTVNANFSNSIVAWDSLALRAIANAGLSPDEASRDLAILHAAQYDAVAAIQFPKAAYRVNLVAPKGASAPAAASSAADTVLESLFPAQASAFQSALGAAKSDLNNSKSDLDGLALGKQVALATLANRAADGSNLTVDYTPTLQPNTWRPTAPLYGSAVDPQWGGVTPFEVASGSEFRPAAPPAPGGAAFDQALEQVASLGRLTSATRTLDQANAAEFWADGAGTSTNPGHWNEIAEEIANARGDSLAKDARLFAQLDFALADAAIASSDAQYTYNTARPITAIQASDPTWVPLLTTPESPSYVSDHAAFGSAASEILSATFGANTKFTDDLYLADGVTRSFNNFAAAATESASSQVWGGVNFPFDAEQGSILGAKVGREVLTRFPAAR